MGMVPDPPSPSRIKQKVGESGSEMSFTDAICDGVRFKRGGVGNEWYYPLCHKCGAEVPTWRYESGTKYTCKKCKLEERLTQAEAKKPESVEAKKTKLEKAIDRIGARYNLKEYEHAIDTVTKMIEDGGQRVFDSTEEIIVALILVKNDIKFRHQVRFGTRYRADFVLDDMKVVLEVDGDIFHGEDRAVKQKIRDDLIIAALGPEWEIIRIKTSALNLNAKRLPKALTEIIKKRKMYRSQYNGQLPDWYNAEG